MQAIITYCGINQGKLNEPGINDSLISDIPWPSPYLDDFGEEVYMPCFSVVGFERAGGFGQRLWLR